MSVQLRRQCPFNCSASGTSSTSFAPLCLISSLQRPLFDAGHTLLVRNRPFFSQATRILFWLLTPVVEGAEAQLVGEEGTERPFEEERTWFALMKKLLPERRVRAGVVKYATGKWRTILKDPEFAACLAARSNVDLKDKWRNLMSSLTPGWQGSKTLRQKPLAPVPISLAAPQSPATTYSAAAATSTAARNHSPRCDYDDMILEALTALLDPNGTNVATIASFMEERHQFPPNFRRALSSSSRDSISMNSNSVFNVVCHLCTLYRPYVSGQLNTELQLLCIMP